MTPLPRVAAIVIPNCAVAGCHDAVSKTHGMDLSTAEEIRTAWMCPHLEVNTRSTPVRKPSAER